MPEIDHWINQLGRTGQLLHQMGAAEGAAGNMSLFLPEETMGLRGFNLARFPRMREYSLPDGVRLPSGTLLITGSGRRLRDVLEQPDAVLCAIVVDDDGSTWLHRSKKYEVEPTSEIDSHAGIQSVVLAGVPKIHATVHAQPPDLTYLTHIPAYRDGDQFNRQLLRWLPETIVTLPEGFRLLDFEIPGTPEQGKQTRDAMNWHRFVVWAKHGVIVRSRKGPVDAFDLIEYAESAASYERLDLQCGRLADGLSVEDLRAICKRFDLKAPVLDDLPEDTL